MATTELINSLPDALAPRTSTPKGHGGESKVGSQVSPEAIVSDAATVMVAWALAIGVQAHLGNTLGAGRFWREALHWGPSMGMLLQVVLLSIVALLAVSHRFQLYSQARPISLLHEQRLSFQACCTCGLLVSGMLYLVHGQLVPRSTFLVTWFIMAAALSVRRLFGRMVRNKNLARGIGLKNILIVGTGIEAVAVKSHIEKVHGLGFRFKGFVQFPGFMRRPSVAEGMRFSNFETFFEFARKEFIDEIFVAAPHEPGTLRELLAGARAHHVDLRIIPEMHDGLVWDRPLEYIGQFPSIPLHAREIPRLSLLLKRGFDLAVASIALALMLLPMLLIALLVKLDSSGPIFYRAPRVGYKGRLFKCTKFRTMIADADARRSEIMHLNERKGVLFKISNDPRITRVGRFLRKYSLDELPQLFDVMRGDMSLVGPRPPIASEVSEYQPNHLRRLDVMPGITGLWQVQARQDPSFDSYISLDLMYVEQWSIWLDLKILARTIGVVFSGTGS